MVEAQLPSNTTQSVPVADMASMQIQSPATSNLLGGLSYGCDPQEDHEIDEDEEDYCEPTEKIAPELLTEAMICSGYLLKRGEKRKVGHLHLNTDMEEAMGSIARIATSFLQEP